MHTDTTLSPSVTTPPTMPNTEYTSVLREHIDDIKRIAATYAINGRVNWTEALRQEPQLEAKLIVGPGPRQRQIKRIQNMWFAVTGRRKKYDTARYKKMRAAQKAARDNAVPINQPPNNYAKSTCALFDSMRQRLEVMAQTYRNPTGGTAWKDALANSPDIAKDLGYDKASPKDQHNLRLLLGFWYRDRMRKPLSPLVREAPQGSLPTAASTVPTAVAPAPALGKLPRFCAHCGEPILYATRTSG